MYSRCAGGRPVASASVLSGNFVGLPMPSQCQWPASVFAYRSRPLDAVAVMVGPASVWPVRVQRAWIALVIGGEPHQHTGRIAAQVPDLATHHILGPRRQPVVGRLQIAIAQALDGELFGIVPLQFGWRGRRLCQAGATKGDVPSRSVNRRRVSMEASSLSKLGCYRFPSVSPTCALTPEAQRCRQRPKEPLPVSASPAGGANKPACPGKLF